MLKFKNIKWLPLVMALSILGIIAFQVYWIKKTYEREERTVEMRSNFMFRETIFNLQSSKLKLDNLTGAAGTAEQADTAIKKDKGLGQAQQRSLQQKMSGLAHVLLQNTKHYGNRKGPKSAAGDSATFSDRNMVWHRDRIIQFLYDLDSLQDPIKLSEIDTAFARRLHEQNIEVPFSIKMVNQKLKGEPGRSEVTIGFSHPVTYKLELGNKFPFLIKRISAVILLSFFLVAFLIFTFYLLYRNLLRQQRLADMKNELISNITHELKTPIATVSVAIEALRSFNGSIDAARTKEYLDISANELQRLSLLVDKVLKLSMFEKKEIDLKYELLDMRQLVEEVTSSMRLQFEKNKARVSITTEGDTTLQADRLHLISVLFNLIDNALKYSHNCPQINIHIAGNNQKIILSIADKGIGIPTEYKDKVFEKFFRVPTGNIHNAKGYGLGLSYVAHVVNKHKGTIKVESIEGEGCNFIIGLPKTAV